MRHPVFIVLGALLLVGGCGASGVGPSFPAPSADVPVASPAAAASPTTSGASQATRAEIVRVLGDRSIGVEDARTPYQPPASARLQGGPRLVVQAFLPKDPTAGNIVIYELPAAGDAISAGAEMAAWIASGVGRVNFTPDARFVLRQLGPTLVFYTYAPDSLADPAAAAAVAEGLSTIGTGIAIPS